MDVSFTGSVFLGMSVDGFIARLDGDLSWLTGDSEAGGGGGTGGGGTGGGGAGAGSGSGGDFGFAEFLSGIDALVMGRATYQFIAPFADWPYQGRPVHVLSTSLPADVDPRITVHRSADVPLEHVGTRSFAGGTVQSTYRVRR